MTRAQYYAAIVEELPFMWRYAYSLTHDREEAEDLRSEGALRALEFYPRFDPRKGDMRSLLSVIILNTFKVAYNHRRYVFAYRDSVKAEKRPSEASIAVFDRITLVDAVKECRRKEVIMFAQGYTYAEIAEASGIVLGTIKRRIHDERKRLRKVFEL